MYRKIITIQGIKQPNNAIAVPQNGYNFSTNAEHRQHDERAAGEIFRVGKMLYKIDELHDSHGENQEDYQRSVGCVEMSFPADWPVSGSPESAVLQNSEVKRQSRHFAGDRREKAFLIGSQKYIKCKKRHVVALGDFLYRILLGHYLNRRIAMSVLPK